MSLIGRTPPSRLDVDPLGYWSKPKPAVEAQHIAGHGWFLMDTASASVMPPYGAIEAGPFSGKREAEAWIPHRADLIAGRVQMDAHDKRLWRPILKPPLSPSLDMPREGYGSHTPTPKFRARPTLRAIEGGRSILEATIRDKSGEYPTINRGALRKAIQLGRIEARWWNRTDDMLDFRRDTNNPWLPARIGTSDDAAHMTFAPYWFKERGIRAYKSRADESYRLAITHNLILQLREK